MLNQTLINRIKAQEAINTASELLQNNKLEASFICLHQYLEQTDPTSSDVYNYLGWIYSRIEQFDEAEKCYRMALSQMVICPATYVNLIVLLNAQQRLDEIEPIFQKAILINEIRKDILFGEYGISLEKQGNFSKAIENYKKSIQYSLIFTDIVIFKDGIERCEFKNNNLKN
jgi:tetratricopeptide (TPR) repeat protein